MNAGSGFMHEPLTPEEVAECNRAQMEEMDLHKYLESEKAKQDLGKAAHLDWIIKHAKAWRDAWMQRRAQRLKERSPQKKEDSDTRE